MKKLLFFLFIISFIGCDKDIFPFEEEDANYILLKENDTLINRMDAIEIHTIVRGKQIIGKRVVGTYSFSEQENILIMDFSLQENTYTLEYIEWYYGNNSPLNKAYNQVSLQSSSLIFTQDVQSYKNVIKGYYRGELAEGIHQKTDVEISFYIDFRS